MDPAADYGIPNSHTTVGGRGLEQELPLSSAGCQTESGGPLLLQLLEFKTHLFEAVEELHIRRDAETRFEDQISKLVLAKQELEWEKESLQHRIKTLENQHTESVTNVKKQFQAKIRNIEEEKGKYQVSAELNEKEINSLKEELRSLQEETDLLLESASFDHSDTLLKYNLEKKSNELEQKLSLQSRLKDGHLNQLGEVEKRFSVLSRQCAMVKQAHEKLEQNVAESMRINKTLTSANEQQEATIVLLKKELEEMSSKLIKDRMTSVRRDRADSHTGKEQHVQKLQQKLNMETEMNKKLREENEAVRTQKQEVLRSLQCTQQLLLSQTQTVNTLELELQTQKEQYQALKQEHEVMRDKSKAMEDKVAQLMERYAAFKTDWDKEKKTLQDCISCEQQDLRAAREAYDELHEEHVELSSVAKAQAQHICELEMKSSSQSLCVSTQVLSPDEPVCSSELPGLGLQHSARNPDCFEDTGAVTNLDATGATGATGGQEDLNHHPQPLNLFTCPFITNNLCSPSSQSATGTDTSIFKTSETDPGVDSDLMKTISSVSDNDLMISEGGSVSGTTSVSSHEHKYEAAMSEETNEGGNRRMTEKDDEGRDKRERNAEQQRKRDEVQGEDVEEGGGRGTDRHEENQGSAEDAETERRDRAEERETGRAERGETGSEPAETQILTQTTEEKGDTQQVIDFTDTEPPLVFCEPSVALSQKETERDPDSCHSEESLSVNHVSTDVQNLRHSEVQTHEAESPSPLPSDSRRAPDKTTDQKPTDESVSDFPVERSSFCSSQANVEPAQTNSSVSIQELETTTAQTASNDPSDVSSSVKQRDEMSDKHVNEGYVQLHLVPQSQDTSEQERGRVKGLGPNDDDCGAYKKSHGHSNDGASVQECVEKSNLNKVAVDVMRDAVDPESEVESLGCQSQHRAKNDKIENVRAAESHNSETHLKPCVLQTGPRSSFSWPSVLHQRAQESEQNTSGRFRNPLSSTPMFSKSQQSKVPLVITRASDLLNASSVSGNAASSTRHQQGEWKALGETCRETATADTESRASLSTLTSPTVSTSSSTVSDLSWTVTSGCSRAPGSASGPVSESEWELSCSQEREDQQSSFRAQISKIEHFLNTERLHLAKRRRIDN